MALRGERFSDDEIVGIVVVSCLFGFGIGLIVHRRVGEDAAFGVGIISTIVFGFLLGAFIKVIRKTTS